MPGRPVGRVLRRVVPCLATPSPTVTTARCEADSKAQSACSGRRLMLPSAPGRPRPAEAGAPPGRQRRGVFASAARQRWCHGGGAVVRVARRRCIRAAGRGRSSGGSWRGPRARRPPSRSHPACQCGAAVTHAGGLLGAAARRKPGPAPKPGRAPAPPTARQLRRPAAAARAASPPPPCTALRRRCRAAAAQLPGATRPGLRAGPNAHGAPGPQR